MNVHARVVKTVCGGFLLSLFLFCQVARGEDAERVAGYSVAEALRLGEAMYLKGTLPSGKPIQAVVQGDIELTGTMATCANCHMRSGLGSMEGGVLTLPISGRRLYAPLVRQQDLPGSVMNRVMFKNPPRPAYGDATLAEALLHGIDPGGRELSETMPRYELAKDDLEILIFYLKRLSSTISPGADEEEIRFATVVSDRVSAKDREALLLPIKATLNEEWNERLRVQADRWNTQWYGPAAKKAGTIPRLRKAVLDVWELKGEESSWREQLEAHYGKRPVFALVGGMVPGSWDPVHRFCEENRIPSLFPVTDLPTVSASDWYTLYFSKGVYQEGEAAARYLAGVSGLPEGKRVVQVLRGDEKGRALAGGFDSAWREAGRDGACVRRHAVVGKVGPRFFAGLRASYPGAVLLLWLSPEDLAGAEGLAASPGRPAALFFSGTLLGATLTALPERLRDFSLITYPRRLPEDEVYTRAVIGNWMKVKKIPADNLELSARSYFFTRMLSRTLLDMGGDLYRDYFLDLWDMAQDQTRNSLQYPRLSFGSGQRYASKGCYVVSLAGGENPKPVRKSDWVIY